MCARRHASGRTARPQRSRSAPPRPCSHSKVFAQPTTRRRRSAQPRSRPLPAFHSHGRRSLQSAGRLASPPRSETRSKRASRSGSPLRPTRCTYPLLRLEPAATTADALDLGSDPSLAAALRIALTTGKPQLSAPVRVQGDGRLGVFAFVPVFGRGLPLRTPAERREALTGVVTGALAADALVRNAFSGLPAGLDVRVTDGPPSSRTAPAAPRSPRHSSAAARGASHSHPPPPRRSPRWAWRSRDSP